MSMDKYEFISNILERDHLKSNQKEKILKLALIEIEKDRLMGLEIHDRVKKLEEQIRSEKILEPIHENPHDENPTYVNPAELHTFLKKFNSDPILSTTSHKIDLDTYNDLTSEMASDEYSFKEHMRLVEKKYWILDKEFPKVSNYIKSRIRTYLFSEAGAAKFNGWSDDGIKITWNCKPLKEWTESNPRVPPNPDDDLVKNLNCSGFDDFQPIKAGPSRIRNMGDLVVHFKDTIRINFNNNLYRLLNGVNEINKEWHDKMHIEINESDLTANTELFTDVDKLKQCYRDIIRMAFEVPLQVGHDRHYIKVTFEDKGNQWELSIHHLNSVFTKTPHNLLNRLGRNHRNLRNKAIGLCDLYLIADFGNSVYATINILDDRSMNIEPIPEFKGVKHTLVFKS